MKIVFSLYLKKVVPPPFPLYHYPVCGKNYGKVSAMSVSGRDDTSKSTERPFSTKSISVTLFCFSRCKLSKFFVDICVDFSLETRVVQWVFGANKPHLITIQHTISFINFNINNTNIFWFMPNTDFIFVTRFKIIL